MSAGDALMSPAAGDDAKAELGVNAQFSRETESVEVTPGNPVIGLTKEQLEKYRNEPFYRTLRWVLFAVFWLTWAALFGGALALIFLSPRKTKDTTDPLKGGNTYEVFVPGFFDSDNDGVGDFTGVEKKLGYFTELNIDTLILTPVFKVDQNHFSPEFTRAYDEVDSRFGGVEGLKQLINAAGKNFKIFVDVPVKAAAKIVDIVAGIKMVEKLGVSGVYIGQPWNSTDSVDIKYLDSLVSDIRTEVPNTNFGIFVNSQNLIDLSATKANVIVQDTIVDDDTPFVTFLSTVEDSVSGNVSFTQTMNSVRRERVGSKLPLQNRVNALALLNALRLVAYPIAITTYGDEIGLIDSVTTRSMSFQGYFPWDTTLQHNGFSSVSGALFFDPLHSVGSKNEENELREKFITLSTIRRNFKFSAAKAYQQSVIRESKDNSGTFVLYFNDKNVSVDIDFARQIPNDVKGINKVAVVQEDGTVSTNVEDYSNKVEMFAPYQYRLVKLG